MNSQGCQDGGYNYGCWQSKIAPFWIFDLSEIEESFIIESVHFNGYILGSAWTNTLVNISTNNGLLSTSISSYLWQGGDWSSGNNNNWSSGDFSQIIPNEIFEAGILSGQLNLIAYTSTPWTTYSISNSGLNAPRLVIEYDTEDQFLICEDGEVDLGWGDCNALGNSLFIPDGCKPSGCFSVEDTYEINFSYTYLGEFPSNIGDLVNMNNIHISDCGLYGSLPPSIGNLENLVSMQIYDNDHDLLDSLGLNSQLSGIIPTELANLESLQYIRLDNNDLNGEVPIEFGQLNNLVSIILNGNQLSGEIPQSMVNLTTLVSISLSENQLSGTIPSDIVGLINLETIDLSNNSLTGEIPIGLEEIPNLYYVNLANNQLSGSISENFCDIYFVDFSYNAFCSPYAQCLSSDEVGWQDSLNCSDLDAINDNINANQFRVYQNYPNPFNPSTFLRYNVSNNESVNITIYDISGKVIKALQNNTQRLGYNQIKWNARNQKNENVPAGIYLYTITSGSNVQTMKMILLK